MKTIFLIDDDEDDQFLFKEALASFTPISTIEVAINGRLALDRLMANDFRPEIIFVDLNMPVMKGFEFLEHFKKDSRFKTIPIGIYSTSNLSSDVEQSKLLGARFFFTKPGNFQTLCKNLRQLIDVDFSQQEFVLIDK